MVRKIGENFKYNFSLFSECQKNDLFRQKLPIKKYATLDIFALIWRIRGEVDFAQIKKKVAFTSNLLAKETCLFLYKVKKRG